MEQGVKAAESRGQLPYRGTASNGGCVLSHCSLKPPFQKFISLKLICYTITTIKNHTFCSKAADQEGANYAVNKVIEEMRKSEKTLKLPKPEGK